MTVLGYGVSLTDVMGRSDEVLACLEEIKPGLEALDDIGDFPLCIRQDGGVFSVSDLIELFYGRRGQGR